MLENRKFHIFLVGAGLLVFGTAVAWFGIIQQQRSIEANAPPKNRVEQQSEASIRREGLERGAPRPDRFDEAPSFDVIRIEPSGEAVIAGRSAPGATVRLLRDGKTYAETVADNSGLFALVPPPLPPGPQSVILQTIGPDGVQRKSRDTVTIVLNSDRSTKPLVTLASPGMPTAVLSLPSPPTTGALSPQRPSLSPVEITTIDAETGGRLMVSGRSASGALVRFHLNDSLVASAEASGEGRVSFAIGQGVQPGAYRIRLDEVDPTSGGVRSRAEVNFAVPVNVALSHSEPKSAASGEGADPVTDRSKVLVPAVNTAIVARRESLWRISSRIFGKGVRYTEIYQANQDQIRNPNRIYPGQIFVLPADPGSAGR